MTTAPENARTVILAAETTGNGIGIAVTVGIAVIAAAENTKIDPPAAKGETEICSRIDPDGKAGETASVSVESVQSVVDVEIATVASEGSADGVRHLLERGRLHPISQISCRCWIGNVA